MTQPLYAKGVSGQLSFDGFVVTISRKGFVARTTVGKGEKRIPISSITAVQWKNAGMSAGFIQFTIPGGVERRSSFGKQTSSAASDENSVTFYARHQPAFAQIRAAIEQAIVTRQMPAAPVAPAPPQSSGPPPGWYSDPQGDAELLRWWDGQQYTSHVQPRPR